MNYKDFVPNGFKPDFIFIDAAHDYESAKHDIEKSMSMNPWIIAGHDYDSKVWPGVVKAVDENSAKSTSLIQFGGWKMTDLVIRLILLFLLNL